MATPCQYGSEILANRAPSAGVCNHQSFLHCPRILTGDEPVNPFIAVVRFYRMGLVHRLTLSKDPVLGGLNGKMFTLHEEQHQIRLLGRMRAVVVGHFRCPHDIPYSPSIKPFYLLGFEEPILQNRMKLPRNVIFTGSREDELSRGIFAEQLKRLYQSQVQGQNNA
jgi:hypothetical protein